MDERGLWRAFFATGLPELYLAIREERAKGTGERSLSVTAFRARGETPQKT